MIRRPSLKKLGYPIDQGKAIIEIHTDRLNKIFDEKDPSPLLLKDLDDSFVEYLFSSAEEIGHDRLSKVKIYFYQNTKNTGMKTVRDAFKNYFEYQVEITKRKIYKELLIGFKSLIIGVTCMLVSLAIIYSINNQEASFLKKFITEGLLLFSWVSLWKPVNTFLYEWWPTREDLKIYQCLADVEVEVLKQAEKVVQISSNS